MLEVTGWPAPLTAWMREHILTPPAGGTVRPTGHVRHRQAVAHVLLEQGR